MRKAEILAGKSHKTLKMNDKYKQSEPHKRVFLRPVLGISQALGPAAVVIF